VVCVTGLEHQRRVAEPHERADAQVRRFNPVSVDPNAVPAAHVSNERAKGPCDDRAVMSRYGRISQGQVGVGALADPDLLAIERAKRRGGWNEICEEVRRFDYGTGSWPDRRSSPPSTSSITFTTSQRPRPSRATISDAARVAQ
jgi:hypothetical protein